MKTNSPTKPPIAYALRLAREKAQAVAAQYPQSYVLGADTIVVIDGEVLGKPIDHADAARMLRLLSGRSHEVTTAVSLIAPSAVPPNLLRRAQFLPAQSLSTLPQDSCARHARGDACQHNESLLS